MNEAPTDTGVAQLFTDIPGDIAKAMVALQAEVQALGKTAKNDHFKNTYAPLDEVMDNALPLLASHSLGLMQWPITKDGKHYLHTVLLHESGVNLQADIELLLVKQDPQGLGSAITYTRRQTVMAILGLSAKDEDDDGNKASNHLPPATSEQIEQIIALCRDLKYPEEDIQRRVRTLRTFDHANLAISKLEQVISGRAAQKDAAKVPVETPDEPEEQTPPSRDTQEFVAKRLQNFGFVDSKKIKEFIRVTTGKPLIGNCKEPELHLLNEKLDQIEAGEETLPGDWINRQAPEADEAQEQPEN